MNGSAIKDLHNDRYLKLLSKLHEPLGEWNMKEFSNITSFARAFVRLHIYYMTEKIVNARALICSVVQIKN